MDNLLTPRNFNHYLNLKNIKNLAKQFEFSIVKICSHSITVHER